jgi:hypothetical protein
MTTRPEVDLPLPALPGSARPVEGQDLPDELRQRLAVLADILLPGSETMPAAGAVDLAGVGIRQVLTSRPDLRAPLEAVLAACSDQDAADFVARLRSHDPAGWATLTTCVTAGYYMRPPVRQALGYAGQEGRVVTADEFVSWVTDGLLDPVISRGPLVREAPA